MHVHSPTQAHKHSFWTLFSSTFKDEPWACESLEVSTISSVSIPAHRGRLSLPQVLADGTVLDGLSTMRKDNTGQWRHVTSFPGPDGPLCDFHVCLIKNLSHPMTLYGVIMIMVSPLANGMGTLIVGAVL